MKSRYHRFIQLAALVAVALGCVWSTDAALRDTKRGVSKPDLLEAEKLLSSLGYWILKVDGRIDPSTRHAITAFQKVEGRKRTGRLTAADLEALRIAVPPTALHVTGTTHVEIDISRQVLFLVDSDGAVVRILAVSSGNEKEYFDQGKWQLSHRPRGHFRFVRNINGVREATLGKLY